MYTECKLLNCIAKVKNIETNKTRDLGVYQNTIYRDESDDSDLGKRGCLDKDSSLGSLGINLQDIDLRSLIGGQYLTIACILSTSRTSIALYTLIDSGANGFIFVNILFVIDLARAFNIMTTWLPSPILVKGYNSKPGKLVTYYI